MPESLETQVRTILASCSRVLVKLEAVIDRYREFGSIDAVVSKSCALSTTVWIATRHLALLCWIETDTCDLHPGP